MFYFVAIGSIALYSLVLELCYNWHVAPIEGILIQIGHLLTIGAIIWLWESYPSRTLVLLVGLVGLVAPVLSKGNGIGSDFSEFIFVAIMAVAGLVLATHLRVHQSIF